jgi:hypothetical protein
MPRVVPSQVVTLIDQAFPGITTEPRFPIYSRNAATLSAIVELSGNIPGELITISGDDYADFVHGLESLTHSVERWLQRGGDESPPYIKGKSPVAIVREMLAKCPDQSPAPPTTALTFVSDSSLRDSIRTDLSTASSALHNGEWKASTVLAGAVVEALLLWAIQARPAELARLSAKPSNPPERWDLGQFIDVAQRKHG